MDTWPPAPLEATREHLTLNEGGTERAACSNFTLVGVQANERTFSKLPARVIFHLDDAMTYLGSPTKDLQSACDKMYLSKAIDCTGLATRLRQEGSLQRASAEMTKNPRSLRADDQPRIKLNAENRNLWLGHTILEPSSVSTYGNNRGPSEI